MTINFPNSPSNGQQITSGGKTYTYNSSKAAWKINSFHKSVINVKTQNTLDSAGINTILSTSNDVLDSSQVVSLMGTNSNKVYTVATMAALGAVTGMNTGNQALVTSTNKIFMYNGTGWYIIATITNGAPSAISGVDSSYTLAADGTATVINAIATDPEGLPLTWSSTTSGLGDIATIAQGTGDSSNYFTVTPASSDSSSGGTFTLTIAATDGVNGAVNWPIGFTLTFGPNWSASFASPTEVLYSGTQTQNDAFGSSVAVVGNTAVVGTGASVEGVDVYSKSGGSWTHVQRLLPSDTASGDQFGLAIVITPDESTIIVAAPGQDDNATMAGKVYTFTYSGSTWSQASAFQAPGTLTAYETFGRVMAISPNGNTLAIGQPGYDGNSTSNTGRVLIYTGSGSSWTFRKSILPTDAASSNQIGNNGIALSDTAVVFGSTNHKWGTASTYYGAAWVWTGSGASWSQQAKLDWSTRTSPYNVNKGFGQSVAISGDQILIGASADRLAVGQYTGSVFYYTRSGSTWTQQQIINKDTPVAGKRFGQNVAFHPDDSDIFFCADNTDFSEALITTGEVMVFEKSGGSWSQINTIANPGHDGDDPSYNSSFGQSLAVSDVDLLIGCPGQRTHPTQTTWGNGAAYFYEA